MNRKLAAGLALAAALAALAIFGGALAPYPADHLEAFRVELVDGMETPRYPPEGPTPGHLLGTDPDGYDLFSEMLRGARWTFGVVFATALLRAAVGLASGMLLGAFGRKAPERRGFSPFAAIPGFALAAFTLFPLTINSTLSPLALFAAQVAVLAAVELPALVASFATRTAWILERPFAEAARSSGAGRTWLLGRHALPFLLPQFLETIPAQALSVASLAGKLGVVLIFLGGTIMTTDPRLLRSASGEWIGLLAYYRNMVWGRPWLFLAPFAGWIIVYACASLLASGLRKAFADARRFAD